MALRLAAGAALVAANAFFVAVEFALTRLRGLDLTPEEIEARGLGLAWALTERLEIHLTGCQLGISASSVLLGVVAEPALTALFRPAVELVGVPEGSVPFVSVAVGVVLLNLVHKIWGEQAPTYLGVERPEAVARRLAPGLRLWSKVMSPVIRFGDGLAKRSLGLFGVEITRSWLDPGDDDADATPSSDRTEREGPHTTSSGARSELAERMAELLSGEGVPRDRRDEVLQALRIDDIAAREIMIPPEDILWLSLEEEAETHLRRIGTYGRVRYPVLEAGREPDPSAPRTTADVAGTLYVPSLFAAAGGPAEAARELRAHLSQAMHLPASTPVSRLIDRFQEERHELALLVEDEHGRTAEQAESGPDQGRIVGLVTISDALEVITGELEDPLDRQA